MSATTQSDAAKAHRQTVRDLVTIDDGIMGPTGDKADLIKDEAAENLDMTVVEFCENVIRCNDILADRPSESYVRQVLRECRPHAVTMFDNDEITYA
jgi:hypothetical protein